MRTFRRAMPLAALAILLAACTTPDADPATTAAETVAAEQTAPATDTATPSGDPTTPTASPEATPAETVQDPSSWVLTRQGFGPLQLGMTAEDVVQTGGFVEIPFCDIGAVRWTGRMIGDYDVYANLNDQGVIWAINLTESPAPTNFGLDFGMTIEEVRRIFGDRLVQDSRATGDDGIYAVNGPDTFLKFVIVDGVVDDRNTISLQGGNVDPDTVPNASNCREAWRQ